VYKLFEQNCSKGDSLVGMMASGLLADMIPLDAQTGQFITQKIQSNGLSLLIHLIDPNQSTNKGDLRLIQGTNFGCPYSGFYDQPINLLNKAQQKSSNGIQQKDLLINHAQKGSELGEILVFFLLNMSSKTDLSPKGLISLVSFIHDTINLCETRSFLQKVFKNALKLLCSLLRDNQLLSVQEWPSYAGGG
jgi:fused-like protein